MAMPSFDKMLRPILELASESEITRQSATSAMTAHFGLTPEEVAYRIPSGRATTVRNRAGWAMTFLTKGGLISKVRPKTYRATQAGIAFLREHPKAITVPDLKTIEGWEEAWVSKKQSGHPSNLDEGELSSATPLELIDGAIAAFNDELRSRLLDAILAQSPAFFEQLVLDVLLAMGYGGSREDAAEHLGQSNDEGIDGRINQDPLGLDQILVQAKRYAPDRVIDRMAIQAFVGSLAGKGVTKGIFITTSRFAATAEEFVQRGSNTKIVLIDGKALLDLMMTHHIGVRVERSLEVMEIDQNYFEEDE